MAGESRQRLTVKGVQCVLLDIEGTICPISFVKETLFPYALKALPQVLADKWDDEDFKSYRDAFPEDARISPETLQAHVEDLTKRDVKIAYLKDLQGYLWETGYKTNAYATPLFADVAPKLKEWKDAGVELAIYSSGSVFAQKLLFGHVQVAQSVNGQKRARREIDADQHDDDNERPAKKAAIPESAAGEAKSGNERSSSKENDQAKATPVDDEGDAAESVEHAMEDLQYLISDWFDTTNAGLKTDSKSYSTISEKIKAEADAILFLSDNVKEVDAALAAGMRSFIVDRPGNAALSEDDRQRLTVTTSLADLVVSPAAENPGGHS